MIANTLYFGCRSATKDRHYHDEWEVYEKKGELVYRVACSRDGPEGTARIYVQDLIREDGERVAELLKSGAWVFISGLVFPHCSGARVESSKGVAIVQVVE